MKIYRFYINKIGEFQTPLFVTTFLWWLIIGTEDKKNSGKRDKFSKKSVNIVAQQIIDSFKTEQQNSYTPTSDHETPLSTGLRLTIHKKNRSKDLLNVVSHLQIRANSEEHKGMTP